MAKFDIIDIDKDSMTVSTKGLYRVIKYHDDKIYKTHELVKAKEAIFLAACTNNLNVRGGDMWAEVVSYKDWFEREEREQMIEDRHEYGEKCVERFKASLPQPGKFRRLLTRAAAMVW
jgi:hypothetical protein